MGYRVLEFRVDFEPEIEAKIGDWLGKCRNIWNIGLSVLEDLDASRYWNKEDQAYYHRCPVDKKWNYRAVYLGLDGSIFKGDRNGYRVVSITAFDDSRVFVDQWVEISTFDEKTIFKLSVPCSTILQSTQHTKEMMEVKVVTTQKKQHEGVWSSVEFSNVRGWLGVGNLTGYSCPIATHREPPIDNYRWAAKNSISKISREDILEQLAHDHGVPADLLSVPSEYRYGVLKGLSISWQEYIKSRSGQSKTKRGKPRYKKLRDGYETLVSGRSNTARIGEKDELTLPGLGKVRVPGLRHRWCSLGETIPEIATFKIVKKPKGYYLQLTGELPKSQRLLKRTLPAVGIDPGIIFYASFDDGGTIENPRYYRNAQAQLQRQEREKHRKLEAALILWLNNPDRTVADIKAVIRVGDEDAARLLSAKTPLAITEIVGSSRFNQLKYRAVPPSNRLRQVEKQISRLHEKTKNQRKAFIHKQSTWIVRKHSAIAIENGLQREELRHRAKPKINKEKNCYEPNQKKAKSGLTKSLADAGHGAFIAQLEQKAKLGERPFVRCKAEGSTANCPVCETANPFVKPNFPGQKYHCQTCGFEAGRNQKAAIYLILHAHLDGKIPAEELHPITQDVLSRRIEWIAQHSESKKGKKRKPKQANG